MDQEDLKDLQELDSIFQDIGGNEKLEENVGGDFPDIPDGEYSAEIIAAEFTHSKQTNVPMIKIEFGLEGQTGHVWDYLMLANKDGDLAKTKQAIARSVTKLRELGLDAADIPGSVFFTEPPYDGWSDHWRRYAGSRLLQEEQRADAGRRT